MTNEELAQEAADRIYREGLGAYPESMSSIILATCEKTNEIAVSHALKQLRLLPEHYRGPLERGETVQPQRSKIPETIDSPMDWDARIGDQPPATDVEHEIRQAIKSFVPANENIDERPTLDALNVLFQRIRNGHWPSEQPPATELTRYEFIRDNDPSHGASYDMRATPDGRFVTYEQANAALAAARREGWHECNAEDLRKFEQHEKQLAAERRRCDRAIAQQVRHYERKANNAELKLAAERENRDGFRRALEQRIGEVDELRKQLAAERELNRKLIEHDKPLEDALESIAANTCCDRCQEAALVAKDALAKVGK